VGPKPWETAPGKGHALAQNKEKGQPLSRKAAEKVQRWQYDYCRQVEKRHMQEKKSESERREKQGGPAFQKIKGNKDLRSVAMVAGPPSCVNHKKKTKKQNYAIPTKGMSSKQSRQQGR